MYFLPYRIVEYLYTELDFQERCTQALYVVLWNGVRVESAVTCVVGAVEAREREYCDAMDEMA